MSPKPKNVTCPSEPAPLQKQDKELSRIKREAIFTRVENPFYLNQQLFHVLWLGVPHIFAVYYCYLDFYRQVPRTTIFFELFYAWLGGLGTTVGCHRYWTHKAFKATLPLQIILMIMQTISNQHPIHKWCLDHRIHHKYTDTDADPHNSKRGFWYSHVGWLFLPKRKEHQEKLDTFDMSDLENDPVVRFQCRWYLSLVAIFHFILPIAVFYYVWEIPLLYCVAANFRRYVVSLHGTWCVNSFAHIYGDKPYDKSISSTDNAFVSLVAIGEGFHNYHHVFPWCYRASEFGWKLNPSTMFIDFFAKIGWAYDLKTVSQKMLQERLQRTGDGSHADAGVVSGSEPLEEYADNDFNYNTPPNIGELMKSVNTPIWGWDDDEISDDLRKVTKILRRKDETDKFI